MESFDRKCVILVEDDPSIRDLVAHALAPHLTVHAFADHQEAWEQLPQVPRPAVFVLDVMTPRLDGWTFAQRLKETLYAGIPIVFVTARTGAADVAQGIAAGARALVTKPFKVAHLVEKVGRLAGVTIPLAQPASLVGKPGFRPAPPRRDG